MITVRIKPLDWISDSSGEVHKAKSFAGDFSIYPHDDPACDYAQYELTCDRKRIRRFCDVETARHWAEEYHTTHVRRWLQVADRPDSPTPVHLPDTFKMKPDAAA